MKRFIASVALLASMSSFAGTVASSNVKIAPSEIDQVIKLVDKNDPMYSHKKVSITVTDRGMGTDVSPRFTVLLGFSSMAEMGNISADFKITDEAFSFVSATRKSAGIYEVKTIEIGNDGLEEVTRSIDSTRMFIDEQAARKACNGDFCDQKLKTSVEVKEVSRKAKR